MNAMTQSRWTTLHHNKPGVISAVGRVPESWLCVDCGVNTAPGVPDRRKTEADLIIHGSSAVCFSTDSEVYCLTDAAWKLTGLEGWGGCLCIGCLEKRIGRRLKPADFEPGHPFNEMPGSKRLLKRRGRR
jgi:hypothetical protein